MSTKTTISSASPTDANSHPVLTNGVTYTIQADPTGATSINYSIDATRNVIPLKSYKSPFTCEYKVDLSVGEHFLYVERRGKVNGVVKQLEMLHYPFTVVDPAPAKADDTGSTTGPVVIGETPGNTPAGIPTHAVYKGSIDDYSLPADTKIVRLDGSVITYAEWNQMCRHESSRVWYSVTPGAVADKAKILARIAWAKTLGMKRLLFLLTPSTKFGTMAQYQAFFKSIVPIVKDSGLQISFELVNEPNQAQYNLGQGVSALVSQFINPGYDILHAAGYEVLGASPTGSPATANALAAAGMKADVSAFHPYRPDDATFAAMLPDIVSSAKGRVVDFTEFNVFRAADYARDPKKFGPLILDWQLKTWQMLRASPKIRGVFYYAAIVRKNTPTGGLATLQDVGGQVHTTAFSEQFWEKVA